jgi:hypothetical protein
MGYGVARFAGTPAEVEGARGTVLPIEWRHPRG